MINKINISLLDSFNELGKLINEKFSSLYILEDLLSSDYDYIYGYFIDDELVAFIHVNVLYEVMDIVNIVVSYSHRNEGIATKLINYVIDEFDEVKKVMLEVNINNYAAISLYKKNGFDVINRRKNYYGTDDALIMSRGV